MHVSNDIFEHSSIFFHQYVSHFMVKKQKSYKTEFNISTCSAGKTTGQAIWQVMF